MQLKLWLLVCFAALVPAVAIAVANPQASPQELRLVENLRIGELSGRPEYLFTRASSIAIGRDSSILVREGLSIRRFNSRGEFVRSYGGSGRGPGEFAPPVGITNIGFVGDTIYAIDGISPRVTLFSPLGDVLRTIWRSEPFMTSAAIFFANPSVLLPDGSALGRSLFSGAAEARGEVPRVPYLRSARSGEILDTVVWYAAPRPRALGSPNLHPDLADNQLHAIAPNGTRIAVVERAAAANNRTSAYTVAVVNSQSDTLFRRSYQYSPVPVPRVRRDSIIARAGDIRDSGSVRAPPAAAVAAFVRTIPMHYPPVSKVLLSYDGAVWLRREPGNSDWTWDIVNPVGVRTAFVRIPKHSQLMAVAGQTVWLVQRDSLDVPTLVRYRTVPPAD